MCKVDAGTGELVDVVCGAPNARTGMKSVFAFPGAWIPGKQITLEKGVLHVKEGLSRGYADIIYGGRWFGAEREGLDAYFAKVSERVTGDVRMSLCKGAVNVLGRRSPNTLFVAQSMKIPQRSESHV